MRTVRRGNPGTVAAQSAGGSRSTRWIVMRLFVSHDLRMESWSTAADAETGSPRFPIAVDPYAGANPATRFAPLVAMIRSTETLPAPPIIIVRATQKSVNVYS